MLPGSQVNQVRVIFPADRLQPPVLFIRERHRAEFRKGYFPVDIDLAVDIRPAYEVLLVIQRDGVIAFLFRGKPPLNPLPRALPSVAADRVVQQVPRAGRINGPGGLVLHRIQHLGGCLVRRFRLDSDNLSRRSGFPFRLSVRLRVRAFPETDLPDQHRLPQRQHAQRVRSGIQVDLQALADIPVRVVQQGGLPLRRFRGGRLQLVPLVVAQPPDQLHAVFVRIAGNIRMQVVPPHPGKVHRRQLRVRQRSVQEKRALDFGVLSRPRVVLHLHVVPAALRRLKVPLNHGFLTGQHGDSVPSPGVLHQHRGVRPVLIRVPRRVRGFQRNPGLRSGRLRVFLLIRGVGRNIRIDGIGAHHFLKCPDVRAGGSQDRSCRNQQQDHQSDSDPFLHLLRLLQSAAYSSPVLRRSGISARVITRSSEYAFLIMLTSVCRSDGLLNFVFDSTNSPPQVHQ